MSPGEQPVEIRDYDHSWPQVFRQLALRVLAATGTSALRVEHVGSTAVADLAAKPIIDLDVVVATQADIPGVISRLGALGYVHEGDLGVPGREALGAKPGEPPHHLYVLAEGADELLRHLRFRDALRADPALRERYASLKRALAAGYRCDRTAYTQAKSTFVETVLAQSKTVPRQAAT